MENQPAKRPPSMTLSRYGRWLMVFVTVPSRKSVMLKVLNVKRETSMPKMRDLVARRGRVFSSLLSGLAVVSVLLGVILLTTWEAHLFRATTQDMDFTGLECGTPLNNPGWQTGEPCHGAMNRQFGGAVVLLLVGAALAVAVILGHRDRRRPGNRPQTLVEAGLAYVRSRLKMGATPQGRDEPLNDDWWLGADGKWYPPQALKQ